MCRISVPTCKHLKRLYRGLKLVSVLYTRGLHCVESLAQCRVSTPHIYLRAKCLEPLLGGGTAKGAHISRVAGCEEPPTALSSSGPTGSMLLSSCHMLLMTSSNSRLKCQFGVKCFCSSLVLHKTLMLNKFQREVLSVFQRKNTLNVLIPFNIMVSGLINNDAAKTISKEW